ncbi:uncharacterized protein LOC129878517 isoform X2 [Solanum dulcamara]|uniref:uncharacterized protein LOC129878517 isoform X2 n=1 Tax=Solanum dulcamara TaxID=45834 RepID=UPI0024861397|nr:uncharacterized protein LOC129878517 isoform X2 [Solanum dulcamara]
MGDTTLSEGSSIESLLPEDNIVIDRGSIRKNDSSCLGSKDGAMWSEGDSIESFLSKNYIIDKGSIRKYNSLCPGDKVDATWSGVGSIESLLSEDIKTNSSGPRGIDNATCCEENSIEPLLLKNYIVDIGSNQETNSSYPEGRDDATWSEEGGLFESLLLKNTKINSSCPMWSEEGSIESFLLESYIVDKVSNRETNSSCLRDKDKAILSEEGSSTKSLWMKNYTVDLGLAMQQHEYHAKSTIHEPRSEEEEDGGGDKNNKDIHVIPKQQVCNGIWTFEDQGQQIQGPYEQNEIVLSTT